MREEPGKEVGLTEMECDSSRATGASSFGKTSLENTQGKVCRSAVFPLLTDFVFYVADSMFITNLPSDACRQDTLEIVPPDQGIS